VVPLSLDEVDDAISTGESAEESKSRALCAILDIPPPPVLLAFLDFRAVPDEGGKAISAVVTRTDTPPTDT
jgi:hypothetical protein